MKFAMGWFWTGAFCRVGATGRCGHLHRWVSPTLRVVAIGLALLAGSSLPRRAAAETALDKEMAELAKGLLGEIKDHGNEVQVGDFSAKGDAARHGGSGGTAIAKALIEQLQKLGVTVSRNADVLVTGEFRDVTDKTTKVTTLAVTAHLEDRTGKALGEFRSRGAFVDLATMAAVFGITLSAPPNASEHEREKAIDRAIDKIQPPHLQLDGTRIAADASSPCAIEVLVGPDPGDKTPDLQNYRPRAAALDKDGLAFLTINRGEVYAIKIINSSPYDAAVTVSIDGLNMYAFSEDKNYSVVIVLAGKDGQPRLGMIPGWHITNERSDAFQVDTYSKSAAASLLPSSKSIGTITVSFQAAWPAGTDPPSDEGIKKGTREGDATARGHQVNPEQTKFVEVVRDVGKVRSSVSVHYNKALDPANLPDAKPKP
jgi:hypothetical protein